MVAKSLAAVVLVALVITAYLLVGRARPARSFVSTAERTRQTLFEEVQL